jgi:hypothetical protein
MTDPASGGGRGSNRIVLGIVALALVGIVVYVLATGRAHNPALFVVAAIVVVIIGGDC